MRRLKLLLFIVFFMITAMPTFINPVKSFASNIIVNRNKKFGAELLKKNVILRLNKNYQLKVYVSESIKILSQRGINRYSEVIIPFSAKYQKVKLLHAYTLLNGMFKLPMGKHAVNLVSPRIATNYPIYSSIKYLTLSMPAVEDGSIINFSYEINNFKPIIKNGVFYTDYFTRTIPVKDSGFTLIYPADLNINLYLHNIINKSQVVKKAINIKNKKYIKLYVRFKNIPVIKKESFMPPLKNYRKYISVSTYTSWSGLLNNVNKLFIKSEKADKKIKVFVKKSVGGIKNKNKGEKGKIILIYNDFIKSFRYVGISYGINGYSPEPAPFTFSNGYGDSKSLASLLITMLKIEGINAFPVLVTSLNTPNLNVKSISPKQFDSVIVGVKINGKPFYLYPDSSSYKAFSIPFNLADRKGVELLHSNKHKFITTPVQKTSMNEKVFKFSGRISKKGRLEGKILVIYKGVYSNFKRSSLKDESRYQKKIQAADFLYNFAPGANIKEFGYENIKNISKDITLKINFSDSNYGQIKGDKVIFHQIMPVDMGLIHAVLKPNRIYPLAMGYPFEHIAKITIKLPKKSNIYYLPPALKLSNDTGMASAGCSYSKNKNVLNCSYTFKSKTPLIQVKNYEKYRQLIRAYLGYLKNYYIALSSIYFY